MGTTRDTTTTTGTTRDTTTTMETTRDTTTTMETRRSSDLFTSWGRETPKAFTPVGIEKILKALDSGEYGSILRAKGIVNGEDGQWIEFDYVPEEYEVREGRPDYTGRLCVIGAELKEDKLTDLFGL